MKKGETDFLLFLLSRGAGKAYVPASTAELAKGFGISQQSASRWLSSLEKQGLVERKRSGVKLAGAGVGRLKKIFLELQSAFESKPIQINGVVFTGLNDGRYYLSLEGYRKQFVEKLGFAPFPGTLNLRISEPSKKVFLSERKGIELKGFSFKERVFGALKVFRAEINGVEAALVIPERSHYGSDVVEVASRFFLREKLGLKDCDEVKVSVELNDGLV